MKNSYLSFLLLVSLILFAGQRTAAQEPEKQRDPVEPIATEETLPNDVGEFDLRVSIDYTKNNDEISATLPRVQLFFGIIENLGGEIGLPFQYGNMEETRYGIGSLSMSVKWLMTERSAPLPLVAGFETGLPTNTLGEESENRSFELTPFIAYLKEYGPFNIQGNVKYSLAIPVAEGEQNTRTEVNTALIHSLFENRIDLLAELNCSWPSDEESEVSIAPGIKYNPDDEHFIAFAMPVDLRQPNSGWRAIIHFQLQL